MALDTTMIDADGKVTGELFFLHWEHKPESATCGPYVERDAAEDAANWLNNGRAWKRDGTPAKVFVRRYRVIEQVS